MSGRPHWVIIDEAHHLLPTGSPPTESISLKEFANLLLSTVQPDHISSGILRSINGLLVIGSNPQKVVQQFNAGSGRHLNMGELKISEVHVGELTAWMFGTGAQPQIVVVEPAKIELKRHRRKYAACELGQGKSFYFRGSDRRLNPRAQNLKTFIQLAEGIDDETWLYHLRKADYSRWFRDSVKDNRVAEEITKIEQDIKASAEESRGRIIEIIGKHYTASA